MIRLGLAKAGYEVVECQVNPREITGYKKYVELVRKYRVLDGPLCVFGLMSCFAFRPKISSFIHSMAVFNRLSFSSLTPVSDTRLIF